MAASCQRNLFNDVSMVFNAAMDDKLILASPFAAKTVRSPRYVPAKVVPWPVEQVAAFRAVVDARYRLAVDLGAGCGLRQGEIFGISPDDVDPVRPVLHVVRQVKVVREKLIFAPPKGGKVREVPLPDSVASRLRSHAAEYEPVPVTLPWANLDGEPRTTRLYLTTPTASALFRTRFNTTVWKRAIRAAGITDDRRNGMHVLPSSEDRTRRAIDQAFGDGRASSAGLDTA